MKIRTTTDHLVGRTLSCKIFTKAEESQQPRIELKFTVTSVLENGENAYSIWGKDTAFGIVRTMEEIETLLRNGRQVMDTADGNLRIELEIIHEEEDQPQKQITAMETRKIYNLDNILELDYEVYPDDIDTVDVDEVQEFFLKHGYNVSRLAILHNFDAWRRDYKSGYRDEENGYHLFSPCGCNPLSFRLTTLDPEYEDWQKTYEC